MNKSKICHYCHGEITPNNDSMKLTDKKTKEVKFLHYPHCYVRFTTFGFTEEELTKKYRKYKK